MVDVQVAAGRDRVALFSFLEVPFVVAAGLPLDVGQAVVRFQVGRRGRRAVRIQVGRAGARDVAQPRERLGDDPRVGGDADPDGGVEPFFGQVGNAVAEIGIDR
ncbi:hypothetical protein D9M68_664570 [compost metagenome]